MPRKKKDNTPTASPVTPHGGKPVANQSQQETENTYTIICDTIIKAVSSSKHYLYFLPDKRNIDNAIKLGALYMRDDYSNTSDLEKLGVSEGILLPQDFNRDDFLDVLLNHQTIHSWKVMAYSEAYKDLRQIFLNPYQLSFTMNLFGLDPDADDKLRMIYRTEIQDSVLQQYDDARTAFFQMCVHEGAKLGTLKLNRLQIDLQRRNKVETVFNGVNVNRSRASIAVESFITSNKDRERRDGNHLDNEYNKRLSHFATLTSEDTSKGFSLTDTYIHFEKMYHLLMDADGHQVYFGESAIKNAAANIILHSPAVLQVAVTDMIQDDSKTFFDIFDYVQDTCRRFDQLPNKKKKFGIPSGQRRLHANVGVRQDSEHDDSDSDYSEYGEAHIGLAPALAHENITDKNPKVTISMMEVVALNSAIKQLTDVLIAEYNLGTLEGIEEIWPIPQDYRHMIPQYQQQWKDEVKNAHGQPAGYPPGHDDHSQKWGKLQHVDHIPDRGADGRIRIRGSDGRVRARGRGPGRSPGRPVRHSDRNQVNTFIQTNVSEDSTTSEEPDDRYGTLIDETDKMLMSLGLEPRP